MIRPNNAGSFDSDIIKVLSQLGSDDSATMWMGGVAQQPNVSPPPLTREDMARGSVGQTYEPLDQTMNRAIQQMLLNRAGAWQGDIPAGVGQEQ